MVRKIIEVYSITGSYARWRSENATLASCALEAEFGNYYCRKVEKYLPQKRQQQEAHRPTASPTLVPFSNNDTALYLYNASSWRRVGTL